MNIQTELQQFMRELERESMASTLKDILADPDRHQLTRIMELGKDARYRFFGTKNGRGSPIRFCYSVYRNAAGRFLVWTEKETKKYIRREDWSAVQSKKSAIGLARRRYNDFRAARKTAS